jgi:hypothetical protein
MKTLKILMILSIVLGFDLESVKPQIPSKSSYQITYKITSSSFGNFSPSYGWLNTSPLNCPVGLVPTWIDITKKHGFTFNASGGNYFYLIHSLTLLNSTNTKMPGELSRMEGSSIKSTFNSKWERLTGKPLIDTTSFNYYPLKRTNEATLSDNPLYRFSGNLFNMAMRYKYPRAYEPIKYPQTPYSPK